MPSGRPGDHVPVVLWFTGLSGAGKSTIAAAVADELRCRNIAMEYLDGDAVRLFLARRLQPR